MKYFFCSILLIIIWSCNNKPQSQYQLNQESSQIKYKNQPELLKYKSVQTVIHFLQWYKNNYDILNGMNLVNNASGDYDSTQYYSVNFKETGAYLSKLAASGFISDKYIKSRKEYFMDCNEGMKKYPQNDGPPVGFEADLILLTQEIDGTLESIDHPNIFEAKETTNTSYVKIEVLTQLNFTLSKYNGKWLIDKIDNED
jgi:hypothetical protein